MHNTTLKGRNRNMSKDNKQKSIGNDVKRKILCYFPTNVQKLINFIESFQIFRLKQYVRKGRNGGKAAIEQNNTKRKKSKYLNGKQTEEHSKDVKRKIICYLTDKCCKTH